jgi:hypothetical protein
MLMELWAMLRQLWAPELKIENSLCLVFSWGLAKADQNKYCNAFIIDNRASLSYHSK